MNEHILVAMDWKNRSKEELNKNYDAAAAVAYYAAPTAFRNAYAGAAAAYAPTPFRSAYAAAAYAYYASFAPFDNAAAATAAAASNNVDAVEYWVNEYFEETGENREEYEKALEEMGK